MYSRVTRFLLVLVMALCAVPAFAQQSGMIAGKVTSPDGGAMPGVTVEARSTVLPGVRSAVTDADGTYQLPALPPGDYEVTFTLSGMQTVKKNVSVLLSQESKADAKMAVQSVNEAVTVTGTKTFVDKTSAAITSTLSSSLFTQLPMGTEYRDLIRLIPGVQVTPDSTRGPSSGASGQDNVYNFDGVNVTLPLFGTLSAEPATHDMAQISVIKGGAKAIDFNRAGGFNVDSVSKSGTSQLKGEASYRFQTSDMAAKLNNNSISRYNQNRSWTEASIGGPAIKDKVFFFGSYYMPYQSRDNRSNAYGELPDYSSRRNEGFGKLTVNNRSLLLNGSYRQSKRTDKSDLFGSATNPTTGTGTNSSQKIMTLDGSWIINNRSYLTFKGTYFGNPVDSVPDHVSPATASSVIGSALDLNALDTQGALNVPLANSTAAVNAFRQTYITRYGFLCTADKVGSSATSCNASTVGQTVGGGLTGFASTFDNDNFYRKSGQVAYNLNFNTGQARHDLHLGYQKYIDWEDLTRNSNGWGTISVIGGSSSFNSTPIFFQTAFQQQTTGVIPKIHSEYRSESFEANDTIAIKRLSLSVGAIVSHDELFGQGLNASPGTPSGFIRATGNLPELRKYREYEIPWSKLVQPRLSATYAYDGTNTVYASYGRFNPAASSLPRAASWDRNLAVTINGYFDANGKLFGSDVNLGSTGKLFVPDMTPRRIDEFMVGTARDFGHGLSTRVYWRYKHGTHYWEDTNNNARKDFRTALTPASVPSTYYIEDLGVQLAALGTGQGTQNSYVITELDGAFTKYYETTAEFNWNGRKASLGGSYTWSHYFGNFDQDGSAGAGGNDANIFIGSSNIGDGAGRQLWDLKEGDLHGNRPNVFKAFGTYQLPWSASLGFYALAQSGTSWEAWDRRVYQPAIGTSTSETIRYAEPAGSRMTPSHYQVDVNYTHHINFGTRRLDLIADLYNVGNRQTGYNPQPVVTSATFGQYLNLYSPRRLELTARFKF
jgi:hypothetical protein